MNLSIEALRSKLKYGMTQRMVRMGATMSPKKAPDTGLSAVRAAGFEFGVISLSPGPEGNFGFSDRALGAQQWNQNMIGILEIEDAEDEAQLESFARQLEWAQYLGLNVVLCPLPERGSVQLAQRVSQALEAMPKLTVWLRVPWLSDWSRWDDFRTLCDYHARLSLCLSLQPTAPDEEALRRWLAEPLDCVWIESELLPLAEPLKRGLLGCFRAVTKAAIVNAPAPNLTYRTSLQGYLEEAWAGASEREMVAAQLHDQLVPPVQPLRDHMSSGTYEHFEQAVPKYTAYRDAIAQALKDRGKETCIMVVGAGRGGLVQASLQASELSGVPIQLFAVEKNPNAAVTLRRRNEDEWGGAVTMFEADMRSWNPPRLADILVSELLGGFADNELSPECLDGAQRLLAPGGLSIPGASISYLAPLYSPGSFSAAGQNLPGSERSYGVMLIRARLLASLQPCFRFEHPTKTPGENARHTVLRFEAEQAGPLHGFIGFFEAELYGDIRISIHPQTETPGMGGWAPIYFPLRSRVQVKAGETIEAHIWRRVGRGRVWYEWAVTQPMVTPIHNPMGRSDSMGM